VEEFLITAVGYLKLAVEAVGAVIVGFGALATVVIYLLSLFGIRKRSNTEIRLFLGRYLVLGLEFQLGSDILSTAVAPTIAEIKILAAIVVINGAQLLPLQGDRARARRGGGRKAHASSERSRAPRRIELGHLQILGTTRGGVFPEFSRVSLSAFSELYLSSAHFP
jgi:uncharacterized membrane protein